MDYLPNVDPTRVGDWLQTYTGRCFWPMDPRPEEVCIEDIARSLAFRCRYGGHVKRFYSVAEHSVLVSYFVPREQALWGLLHDAAEAYSADVPRPLKRMLPQWKPMEEAIMGAVCERYRLPREEPGDVKRVDFAICSDERELIMAPCLRDWGEMPGPLGAHIRCLSPLDAEEVFLDRFDALTSPELKETRRSFK